MAKKQKVMNTEEIQEELRKEVAEIIKGYKDMGIDELSRAKLATEIVMAYLKTDKEIHKDDGFGGELDEEER